jgi:hypothetical protein
MASENAYYLYYKRQQEGSGAVEPYYRSHFGVQSGRGWLGNLMGSAWSYLRPILNSAAKEIGSEFRNTGSNILGDVKQRGREGVSRLVEKAVTSLSGGGARRKRKRVQSKTPGRKRRITPATVPKKRRKKKGKNTPGLAAPPGSIRDIFSPPTP